MKYILLFSTLLTFGAASAQPIVYSHAELTEYAELFLSQELAYLDGDLQFKASPIDARLPERSCQQPLIAAIAGQQTPERQATVQVECTDLTTPWRIFIPVRIQQLQTVVVARTTLNVGQIISADDLQLIEVDTQQVRDTFFTEPQALLGAKVKRRIAGQQPVLARNTCFVCRGEDVTIITEIGQLSIQATGIARHDGLLGERITVKNSRSNKELQGVVTAMGEVTIGY